MDAKRGTRMNKQRFYIKMVVSSLLRRRSRMFVALLAVAIGATILSGLIMIYYDIPRQMGQEFRSYGANFILVPSGNEATISMDLTRKAVSYMPPESITGIAPYRYHISTINDQPFMAAGTDFAQVQKTSPYWFIAGGWPQAKGEALIGQQAADIIRLVPGDTFMLICNGSARRCTVSGVLQTGGTEEAFVFMSLADLEELLGETGKLDVVECSVVLSSEALEALASTISANVPGVSPRLVKRVTDSEGAVLKKLKALIWLVTAIVLLLIMICVATTMMAVVAERRREIGLRKALGASNKSLVSEFMGEGVFLGGFGGILGALLGYAFAQTVGLNVFNRSIAFEPLLIPVTVAASIVISALACIIPVRRACDVDPAIVLRGE
jgi:putative ABC transport system permease protein